MAALPPPQTPALPPADAGRRRFATLRTVLALMLREMSTRYGRTPGGYLWSIIEPLGAILVLSLGFSLLIRTPSLGSSFLLFYASGYLAFDMYQTISNMVARAIFFSRPLLLYPAVTWIDAVLARFLLNSLTSVVISVLLFSGILTVIDHRGTLDLMPILEAMGLAMLLGLGVGTVNCAIAGLFPIWEVAWSIITRPLFLASAILYLYEDLPQVAREILWFNPLVHITGLMRSGFYSTYGATYASPVYVLGISLVLLAFGQILLGRYHRDILNS
ncbi:ABC transporter permease [Seohaeicola nanhaiensis]|uniref:Transport permease protein n=1 Tax=Seohaeicola nanhaiensis TaxID=1387282 RepID=A0ABV9KLZ8_9RHOB